LVHLVSAHELQGTMRPLGLIRGWVVKSLTLLLKNRAKAKTRLAKVQKESRSAYLGYTWNGAILARVSAQAKSDGIEGHGERKSFLGERGIKKKNTKT